MDNLISLLLSPWAIPILMVEFAVSYTLYYRFHRNKLLKVILGLWFTWQNVLVNLWIMSIICWDPPQELTITKRMQRYTDLRYDSFLNRWRHGWRRFICGWTNKFDPGHCEDGY
jgi:hypothetical protein